MIFEKTLATVSSTSLNYQAEPREAVNKTTKGYSKHLSYTKGIVHVPKWVSTITVSPMRTQHTKQQTWASV